VFSPRLKEDSQGRFPPVLYDDQTRLFEDAKRLLRGKDPEVAVFAHGGVSFPVVGPNQEEDRIGASCVD